MISADTLDAVLDAINQEEDIDGPMPEEIWLMVREMTRDQMGELMRRTVRLAKQGIVDRIDKLNLEIEWLAL